MAAVVLVWLIASMSDNKHFRETYNFVFDGIDRSQYAVLQIDSTATFDIVSNGFRAFNRGMRGNHYIHINVAKQIKNYRNNSDDIKFTVNLEELLDLVRSQMDTRGVSEITPVTPLLTLHLSPRCSKAFVPDLSPVQFEFEEMVGLCGEPLMSPDTVWLYGSQASLDKVTSIRALPQTIRHIIISGRHRVALDTSWRKYGDLYISTPTISVNVPVEHFTEKVFRLPLRLPQSNSKLQASDKVSLYPEQVEIRCIVPRNEYNNIQADDFSVAAIMASDTSTTLTPVVTEFPANVRIQSVSPRQIQFIVFK